MQVPHTLHAAPGCTRHTKIPYRLPYCSTLLIHMQTVLDHTPQDPQALAVPCGDLPALTSNVKRKSLL